MENEFFISNGVEGVTILLSLAEPSKWEYLDFHSYEAKLEKLLILANKKYAQFAEKFNEEENRNQSGYTSRIRFGERSSSNKDKDEATKVFEPFQGALNEKFMYK